ncbi:MAG: hypothetical protein ACRDHN_07925, partial [Thermomicrobiales bacterium]
AQSVPTLDQIKTACDTNYAHLVSALDRLADPLPDRGDNAEWSTQQVLSHLIGCLHHVPVQASLFFAPPARGESAPAVLIVAHNDFWLPEYDNATSATFRAALNVAYYGNRAFLESLNPADLTRDGNTTFGPAKLGHFLVGSYIDHPIGVHGEQLESRLPPTITSL